MDLKADQGFINAVLGLFATDEPQSVAGVSEAENLLVDNSTCSWVKRRKKA